MALQSPQPANAAGTCLYCSRWNPIGAKQCSNCGNVLPDIQAPAVAQPGAVVSVPSAGSAAKPGFYRSPLRVLVFGLVAGSIYLVWWTFQLLSFERREAFRRAASPWAILVPIYGLVVIGRALKSLSVEERARLGRASYSFAAVIGAYVGLIVLDRIGANLAGGAGLLIDVATNVIAAGIVFAVQRGANAYQASAHPELGPVPTGFEGRVTWGEIVALILGAVLTLLLVNADVMPS